MALSLNEPQWKRRESQFQGIQGTRQSCVAALHDFEQRYNKSVRLKENLLFLFIAEPEGGSSTEQLLQDAPAGFPLKLLTRSTSRTAVCLEVETLSFFCSHHTPSEAAGLCSKVMLLTLGVTPTCTMLRRPGALYVCGKWLQPAPSFSLWWGDVFSLSNRSGKKPFLSLHQFDWFHACLFFVLHPERLQIIRWNWKKYRKKLILASCHVNI